MRKGGGGLHQYPALLGAEGGGPWGSGALASGSLAPMLRRSSPPVPAWGPPASARAPLHPAHAYSCTACPALSPPEGTVDHVPAGKDSALNSWLSWKHH